MWRETVGGFGEKCPRKKRTSTRTSIAKLAIPAKAANIVKAVNISILLTIGIGVPRN